MSYPDYFSAIGKAHYTYALLEWSIIWEIVRIRNAPMSDVPVHDPGTHIAGQLHKSILDCKAIPSATRRQMIAGVDQFRAAVNDRNNLFHSYPFTDADQRGRLGGRGHRVWTEADLHDFTNRCENVQATACAFIEETIFKYLGR